VQEAGHPQEIEKTEEKGESLPVDLVKLAKIAISPVLGKCLAGPSRNSLTPISLSSPVFSEIQLVTRLHLISVSMGLPNHLRIMETPIEVSTSK
jgi:hypothetical protein